MENRWKTKLICCFPAAWQTAASREAFGLQQAGSSLAQQKTRLFSYAGRIVWALSWTAVWELKFLKRATQRITLSSCLAVLLATLLACITQFVPVCNPLFLSVSLYHCLTVSLWFSFSLFHFINLRQAVLKKLVHSRRAVVSHWARLKLETRNRNLALDSRVCLSLSLCLRLWAELDLRRN